MSDTVSVRVRAVFREVFRLEGVDLPDDLDVDGIPGWDSLGHLELMEAIEDAFEVDFSPAEAVELLSERRIVEAIHARRGAP
jgi:acyl carrier protein